LYSICQYDKLTTEVAKRGGVYMGLAPKKLPYGISDYKTIVEDNLYYVDKTKYIEKLENLHSYYIFFLRPRRFGKTLFTSVLQNYYDIKEKDNFEILFRSTYIGQNPTKERNNYYILKFNFSGLTTDTLEKLEKSFTNIIKISLDAFQGRYGIFVDYLKEGSAANIFEDFITKISYIIDKPVYVIIDEYDHFANELLSFQIELFKKTISQTGFVRKWYEVLKKATETVVKRIFATGISPITLDSLTSGFNIADDITRMKDFNEMMGFTESEVKEIIKGTAKFRVSEKELDELLNILINYYNGYMFSEDAEIRLFNSDMILYYLKSYVDTGKAPRELIDVNIASDYGKMGKLFNLKNKNENMEVLNQIINGEEISASITRQFSMEKDFTKDDFKSLLFYMGLLTIDKEVLGRVRLKVPNYVIKGLYFEYFLKKLNEDANCKIDADEIQDAIEQIALEGSNTKFIKLIEDAVSELSKRDFIKFDEKYIKVLMYAYLRMGTVYSVKSEYEVKGGYIDIALLKREPMKPEFYAIFEVKYIRKSDYEKYGQMIVEEKKNEVMSQISKYASSEELTALTNLKKWVVVFAGDQCVVNMEVQE